MFSCHWPVTHKTCHGAHLVEFMPSGVVCSDESRLEGTELLAELMLVNDLQKHVNRSVLSFHLPFQ